MRIRKTNRNVSVNARVLPEAVPVVARLLKGWDGDGRLRLTSEMERGKTTTVTEQSGLDSLTSISRQTPSPGVSMLEGRNVEAALEPGGNKSEAAQAVNLELQGGSKIVDGGEEGSNLSVEQLWQQDPEGEHITRHYVRRNNIRKGGDGPALAQVELAMAPAHPVPVPEINEIDGIKREKLEEFPSGDMKMEASSVVMKIEASPPPLDIGALKPEIAQTKAPIETKEDKDRHPSTEPEGSLLHTLYLQLLAAGSEGMTLRELFVSFKKQTSLPSLASDWKEQVRDHLKDNSHFDEVKGHYILSDQVVKPKLTSPGLLNRSSMGVSPRTFSRHIPAPRTTVQSADSAVAPPALSVEKREGVQTRRKAYELTIEAVLTQSAMEFRKLQQSLGKEQLDVPEPRASSLVTADVIYSQAVRTPLSTSRKRKFPSDVEDDCFRNIRGSLQAMQARIVAERGVQNGVPCARKDDARKWRCPLIAAEGHSLCEHHKSLQERKRAKKQQESRAKRFINKDSKLETVVPGNLSKSGEVEKSPSAKENVVAGLGNVHAVEALIDLHGHVAEVEDEGRVQPRRISFHDTTEAKSMEEDAANTRVETKVEPEVLIDQVSKAEHSPRSPPEIGTSRASKSPSEGEEELRNIHYERAIPGSLKALHAKILAQSGVRGGLRCARKDGSNDSARKWQCPLNAMDGHTLCEHHNYLKERKRARYAAAKRKSGEMKATTGQQQDDDIETNAQLDEAPALPPSTPQAFETEASGRAFPPLGDTMKRSLDQSRSHRSDEKVHHDGSTDIDDDDHNESKVTPKDEAGVKPQEEEDEPVANPERLMPQLFKNAPKRRYIAAKKTAASVDVVKDKTQDRESSPLIRPPTIPPLPAMYGIRRKAVKNRSLLSL